MPSIGVACKSGWEGNSQRKQEARERLKARWADPQYRERMSEMSRKQKGKPCPWKIGRRHTAEAKRKVAAGKMGNKNSQGHRNAAGMTYSHTEEAKEKIRAAKIAYWKTAEKQPSNGRGGWLGDQWYRSGFEIAVATWLIENGHDFVYEPERFDLGDFTYLPDFYLPALDLWIEVKGWMDERSRSKIVAFRSLGKHLLVVSGARYMDSLREHLPCRQ